jgi:2-(1,2-epoxy-1,2-dihydrophenyl)acetyl-CoA isomerase
VTREVVTLERVGPAAIVTLNRPQVLNAMSFQLTGELHHAMAECERDDEIRVVILTGSGERAFSAGADIHEMADLSEEERAHRNEQRRDWSWSIADFPKPTVGALNGLSYGGGAVLASTLDIRIGCERSTFRFLAAAYGQINTTWTLPLLVGWARAKELLMTTRIVQPDEALQMGLLNRIVPSAELRAAALETANQIAANHPVAVQGIKRLLHEGVGMEYRQRYENENGARRTRFQAPSVREGFKDFLARKGRA